MTKIGVGVGVGYQRQVLGVGAPPIIIDPDALNYIERVELADDEELETPVKLAINDFFVKIKGDDNFEPLKASCILAGARTLSGALTPLKPDMPSPTNFNFVPADYNRIRLDGDGTKYLNSNRNNNADPRNSKHVGIWVYRVAPFTGSPQSYLGTDLGTGATRLSRSGVREDRNLLNLNSATSNFDNDDAASEGLRLLTRGDGSTMIYRSDSQEASISENSQSTFDDDIEIFARNGIQIVDAALSFYSIGEHIENRADLETALVNLIGAYENEFS